MKLLQSSHKEIKGKFKRSEPNGARQDGLEHAVPEASSLEGMYINILYTVWWNSRLNERFWELGRL